MLLLLTRFSHKENQNVLRVDPALIPSKRCNLIYTPSPELGLIAISCRLGARNRS